MSKPLVISQRSWHYRLYRYWRNSIGSGSDPFTWWNILRGNRTMVDYKPKNLCRYFWSIVFMSTVVAFFVLLANLLLLVAFAVLYPVIRYLDSDRHQRRVVAAKTRALERETEEKPSEPKQPGLVRSFVKARKQRACPLIELRP